MGEAPRLQRWEEAEGIPHPAGRDVAEDSVKAEKEKKGNAVKRDGHGRRELCIRHTK